MKEYLNEVLDDNECGIEQGCFAKVMEGSVWDDMNSDKINEEHLKRVEAILDFMKNDF